MGHLIPAGTGFHQHRDAEIEFTVEEPEPIKEEPAEGEENAEGTDGAPVEEEAPLQAAPLSTEEESA